MHPGFPKTGSSTFQYGLFVPLEQQGHIDLRMWRKHDRDEPLDQRPSSRLFMGQKLLDSSLDFAPADDRLCVLSDESFTAPLRLRRNNYSAAAVDPFRFPARIREQVMSRFPDAEIDVLVVIRNQPDLLLAQFVEEFNLVTFKNINILFDEHDEIDLEGYGIYEFSTYIEVLYEMFGRDHVSVLAVEQWTDDPAAFRANIAHSTRVPVALIPRHFGAPRLNP